MIDIEFSDPQKKSFIRIPAIATQDNNEQFTIPNLSGDMSRGKVLATPTNPNDPVNKAYVDTAIAAIAQSDNSVADTAYIPLILYNTDATPPTASTVPIGTLYIQYTP